MRPTDGAGAADAQASAAATGHLSSWREAVGRVGVLREHATCRPPRHTPLTRDDRGAWNERDRALLRTIARARARRDRRFARLVIGELLRPYMPGVQALVARRTAPLRLQPRDREDIASAAIERLLRDIARDPELKGAPFGAVAATKVADAIVDFLRAKQRRGQETLTAPSALPEVPVGEVTPLLEQAAAAGTILDRLRPRERAILYERYVLEFGAGEVAGRRDMSTAAVRMTCSRSLRRIRDAEQSGDVTFPDQPSVSRGEGSSKEEARRAALLGGASDQGNHPKPHDGNGVRESEA